MLDLTPKTDLSLFVKSAPDILRLSSSYKFLTYRKEILLAVLRYIIMFLFLVIANNLASNHQIQKLFNIPRNRKTFYKYFNSLKFSYMQYIHIYIHI